MAKTSPFLATSDAAKHRVVKKDASKSRPHPRSKDVIQKTLDRKEETAEAAKNEKYGNVSEGEGGTKSINVANGHVESGADENAFSGKSLPRTKSLRVRSRASPPTTSAGRDEKRSISLSAIPSRGEQNHKYRRENVSKGGVARVCSALSVGWLWRSKSTNGSHRTRRRMWGAGVWGGHRRREVHADGYDASSDSEDDHSSYYFPSDRGSTRVEAVKVASIEDPGAASSRSRSKVKHDIRLGRLGFKNVEQTETTSFSFVHPDSRRVADRAAGVLARKRNAGGGDEDKGARIDIGHVTESDQASERSDMMVRDLGMDDAVFVRCVNRAWMHLFNVFKNCVHIYSNHEGFMTISLKYCQNVVWSGKLYMYFILVYFLLVSVLYLFCLWPSRD